MSDIEVKMENPAETMRDVISELGKHVLITNPEDPDLTKAHLISSPSGRNVEDLTETHRKHAEYLKPARRKGTANLDDLQSMINWAIRFKGDTSVLYAKPDMSAPTLTCIADYHAEAEADPTNKTGDPSPRHCHHKAIYSFPLSEEWKAWMDVSGQPLGKDDLGEFIESNAKDIMDPTPEILKNIHDDHNEDWENRLILTAQQIEGRYGQLTQLLAMSKQFQVFEKSDLKVSANRDTGEASLEFTSEHHDGTGQKLVIPNLIIITIPVFRGGAPYRMPVRFRYRKTGGEIRFILSVYNPEKAFEAAFDEAVKEAATTTGLPTFMGSPES